MNTAQNNGFLPSIPTHCIVFVAAGSGGHIQSALAVLEFIANKNKSLLTKSIFVGSNLTMEGEVKKESLEENLCKRIGIPFIKMRSGKFQRQLSLNSIRLFFGVFLGFIDAISFFIKQKPSLIVTFGGYSSLPMGIVAKLFGVPLIIHEQTTSIGLTNNILKVMADLSLISYRQSEVYFKGAKKVIMSGSPSREYLFKVKTFQDLLHFLKVHPTPLAQEETYLSRLQYIEDNSAKLPLILVTGGSQGAHIINETITKIMASLSKDAIVFIQTGDNQVMQDYDKIMTEVERLPKEIQQNIIVRKFIYEEMGFLYHHTKQYIGRSGANTVYEIGMLGIPAIFVPISWVTRNEQFTNAKIIEDLGFGKIIEQDSLTPELLEDTIRFMMSKQIVPPKETLHELFPENAAENITNEIMKFAGKI